MLFKKSAFKTIYKAHTYVGLFVAIHFTIFALSGLALLFKDEIQGHVEIVDVTLSKEQTALNYQSIAHQLKINFPNDRLLALFPDDENQTLINVRLGINGATELRGARKLVFDLATAKEVIEKPVVSAGFFDWMLQLHRDLFLGSNGKLYLGFVGLLYVLMLLSGFFIYGKFMKGKTLGQIRPQGIPKLVDLHKFVGVITFGWGLIVGLSGVFLAFNGVLIKLFQLQSLKQLSSQYQAIAGQVGQNLELVTPLKNIIQAAQNAKPDSFVSYISFPSTEFGIPGHYLFLTNGTTPITERLSELVVVNAHTGLVAQIVELPFYLKLVLLSEPLHFGDYGGIFLKIVWALFTICSLAVVLLGVCSFFMKRKKNQGQLIRSAQANAQIKIIEVKSTYPIPMLIALMTVVGMVAALFASGFFGVAALILICVPLAALFYFWRRNV